MARNAQIDHRRSGKKAGGQPRTAGRDTLSQNTVAVARELFLKHGFDGISIDAIAARARTTKRALHSRYGSKSDLFNRAIYDLLGRLAKPIEDVCETAGELEPDLLGIARHLINDALTWQQLALERAAALEAQRRPAIARWIVDERRKPSIHAIASMLERHREELRVADFGVAAEQFASAMFDCYARLAADRFSLDPADVDDRVNSAVDAFLSRVHRRGGAARRGKGRAMIPPRTAELLELADAA